MDASKKRDQKTDTVTERGAEIDREAQTNRWIETERELRGALAPTPFDSTCFDYVGFLRRTKPPPPVRGIGIVRLL